jgi:hypothetical protein
MMKSALVAFHDVDSDVEPLDRAMEVCNRLGFDVAETKSQESMFGRDETVVDHDGFSITFTVYPEDDTGPQEPALGITLEDLVSPSTFEDDAEHATVMGIVFELICRVATELDVEYVTVYNPMTEDTSYIPQDRPVASGLAGPPQMAIYTPDLLDSLGGIEAFYDRDPWYIGTLCDGHNVIVRQKSPWGDGGWTPPMEAEYIERATLHEDDGPSDDLTLGDPFAELEPGAYGADIVIPQSELDGEFDNSTAELVRVYVDEHNDLRRVDDDSFVRNVVTDTSGTEREFIDRMAADLPPATSGEDVPLSVLVNDQIPPSLVQLDDPTDENIVTLVMNLDVSINKYDILMAVANQARPDEGYTDDELESIEGGLSTLVAEDDPALVEAWIREKVF